MENNHVDTVPGTSCEDYVSDLPERGRRSIRFPFYGELRLTPIDEHGRLLHEETIDVVGNNVSVAGAGFSHNQPLKHRRAVVSINKLDIGRMAVEVDIVWTKPTPLGIYESGCRFIRTVAGHKIRCKPK